MPRRPPRADDNTMRPLQSHNGGELVNRKPVVFSFVGKAVRRTARQQSANTRRAQALLKRLNKEREA